MFGITSANLAFIAARATRSAAIFLVPTIKDCFPRLATHSVMKFLVRNLCEL